MRSAATLRARIALLRLRVSNGTCSPKQHAHTRTSVPLLLQTMVMNEWARKQMWTHGFQCAAKLPTSLTFLAHRQHLSPLIHRRHTHTHTRHTSASLSLPPPPFVCLVPYRLIALKDRQKVLLPLSVPAACGGGGTGSTVAPLYAATTLLYYDGPPGRH